MFLEDPAELFGSLSLKLRSSSKQTNKIKSISYLSLESLLFQGGEVGMVGDTEAEDKVKMKRPFGSVGGQQVGRKAVPNSPAGIRNSINRQLSSCWQAHHQPSSRCGPTGSSADRLAAATSLWKYFQSH